MQRERGVRVMRSRAALVSVTISARLLIGEMKQAMLEDHRI